MSLSRGQKSGWGRRPSAWPLLTWILSFLCPASPIMSPLFDTISVSSLWVTFPNFFFSNRACSLPCSSSKKLPGWQLLVKERKSGVLRIRQLFSTSSFNWTFKCKHIPYFLFGGGGHSLDISKKEILTPLSTCHVGDSAFESWKTHFVQFSDFADEKEAWKH